MLEIVNFAPDFDTNQDQIKQLVKTINPQQLTFLPDAHPGKCAPVGFAAQSNNIAPAILGGDSGCGYLSVQIEKINIDFGLLQEFLIEKVPFQECDKLDANILKIYFDFSQKLLSQELRNLMKQLNIESFESFYQKLKQFEHKFRSGIQLSSLGNGNHFLEIGQSSDENYMFITVHSGSRNAGQAVFKQFQIICQTFEEMQVNDEEELFEKFIGQIKNNIAIQIPLLLQNSFKRYIGKQFQEKSKVMLNFIKTSNFQEEKLLLLPKQYHNEYLLAVNFLTIVAHINRSAIIYNAVNYLNAKILPLYVSQSHNYIQNNILRKGSQNASNGKFVVALNCKDGLLLCQTDSQENAPHGSGRNARKTDYNDKDELIDGVVRFWQGGQEGPQGYKASTYIKECLCNMHIQILDEIKSIFSYKRGK